MNTTKINKIEAKKISLTARYGVIGDGCLGIWGEGRTVEAARMDALSAIRRQFPEWELLDAETGEGKTDQQLLDGMWIVEQGGK